MDADASGLWLLPTRGRATTKLPQFLFAAIATGISTRGVLIVDPDDHEQNGEAYRRLILPERWALWVTPEIMSTSEKTQWALGESPKDTEWVGWLGDDLVPISANWDQQVVESLNGWNFVSTDDGLTAPKRMTGAVAWSMDLVRAVGYLAVPGTRHMYFDNMWEELGRLTNCWSVRMDILVRHAHHSVGRDRDATTDRIEASWTQDETAYGAWCEKEFIPAANRILALQESAGVQMLKPDLKDVHLMIATPSGSRRYEGLYMASLTNTMRFLPPFGATVTFKELPYVSDIALARAKLLGAFMRSTATHMLWVDDDMGWQAQDVLRLLLQKQDFVAGVGPAKAFPPRFAVNISDDFGRETPIRLDPVNNLVYGSEVGMAFVLITRACATRMWQHYADLTFRGPDGREDVACFNPMVVNKRYLSEDFAFCWRWRAIGGQVMIMPDVTLQHIGSHTFEGNWLEHLEKQVAKRDQAA